MAKKKLQVISYVLDLYHNLQQRKVLISQIVELIQLIKKKNFAWNVYFKKGKKKRKKWLSLLETVPVDIFWDVLWVWTTKTHFFTVNILGLSTRMCIHIHSTITGIQANNEDTQTP